MQSKGSCRGRKLAVCLPWENRVVMYNLETGEQKEIEVKGPLRCASSQHYAAITTSQVGMHLYSTNGVLVHIVPDSTDVRCAALHPRNNNILAIGYEDGSVRIWDISTQAYVSSFKKHTDRITHTRFVPDGRLFMSSWDKTASIATLDDQFQMVSSIKLEGHSDWVNDTLLLPFSNQCVACSNDYTLNVWNCQTGACLRTLTEHRGSINALAMHPNGAYFASGSQDRTVIIWSCETFEVLRRMEFPDWVLSLVFGESDTLYAGVYYQGVMSCNAFTGEVGPVIMTGTGNIFGLSLSKSTSYHLHKTHHSLTLVTPQYLHPSPGRHPHMHCGPCLHNTLCTWLWWCCGRCAIKDD